MWSTFRLRCIIFVILTIEINHSMAIAMWLLRQYNSTTVTGIENALNANRIKSKWTNTNEIPKLPRNVFCCCCCSWFFFRVCRIISMETCTHWTTDLVQFMYTLLCTDKLFGGDCCYVPPKTKKYIQLLSKSRNIK